MEVTIRVKNVARDITIETDESPEAVAAAVQHALESPDNVLALSDTKGRRLIVPGRSLGWVLVGEGERGRVGFGLTP